MKSQATKTLEDMRPVLGADGKPLTPEELAESTCDLIDICCDPKPHMTPYGEQDDNGVDVSLIRANLRLSPLERLRRGDRATTDALRLRRHAPTTFNHLDRWKDWDSLVQLLAIRYLRREGSAGQ
jgi:hypothetical protein